MTIEIQLWNSERPALVDDDFVHAQALRGMGRRLGLKVTWRLDKSGYVIRYSQSRIKLSDLVMGKPAVGFINDHINRDKLDNRRANFRVIPKNANAQNRSAHRCNIAGLRGVHLRKDTGRYLAHARLNGKNFRLGYYDTPEEAGVVAREFRLRHMPYTVEIS
jgi:hypothetical protein